MPDIQEAFSQTASLSNSIPETLILSSSLPLIIYDRIIATYQ
nr:hypothetical protein [Sediminibacillus massiliensis]